MNGLLLFTTIVVIVFGVLQIILFFKLWGMTNNVSSMKNMMEEYLDNLSKSKGVETMTGQIKAGNLVVRLSDEKQMRVLSSEGYTFVCRPLEGGDSSSYSRNEIELFDEFYKK